MLQINQIRCPLDQDMDSLHELIAKKCSIQPQDITSYTLIRQSFDGRREPCWKISVLLETPKEKKILKHKDPDIQKIQPPRKIIFRCHNPLERPIIVGFGPAGLFAALALAEAGLRPIILERGKAVEERIKDVESFWKDGILNPESNVQFGEGGAGTFSDGKLTTRIKDDRIRYILDKLIEGGADPAIRYQQRPHIGTDKLRWIIKNLRNKLIAQGAEIHFECAMTQLILENGKVAGVESSKGRFLGHTVILAIGHSAKDTFHALARQGIHMEAKDFAVGVRIEHPQSWVNQTQYKKAVHHPALRSAEYRMAFTSSAGRGVYTFCMCPGGTVAAASSAEGQLVINGMSESARDLANANSALLVQIRQSDLNGQLFCGLEYLEGIEKKAWELGEKSWRAPAQWACDLLENGEKPFELAGSYPLGLQMIDLNKLFDPFLIASLKEALIDFDHKMPGFARGLLTAPETRSSCPLRIVRNGQFESLNTPGLYPSGEGAGYAGGIISSALDGLRSAEAIIARFESENSAGVHTKNIL